MPAAPALLLAALGSSRAPVTNGNPARTPAALGLLSIGLLSGVNAASHPSFPRKRESILLRMGSRVREDDGVRAELVSAVKARYARLASATFADLYFSSSILPS
jgi:hypothetical protein